MKRYRTGFAVSIVVQFLALLLFSQPLHSLPRFALDAGASCSDCHINPTGGGMRNKFGAEYYGRTVLPMRTFRAENQMDGYSTNLNEFIRAGADFRSLIFYLDEESYGSFWQMQGDLYITLRATQNMKLYLDKGLYGGFEIFGLINIPSLNSYVKVGKFTPPYGIRMDDHIVYTRSAGRIPFLLPESVVPTPFGERSEDTGIEIGYDIRELTLSAGVFNGNPGGGIRFASGQINAFTVRGETRLPLSRSLNGMLGGSFYLNDSSEFKTVHYGVFGGIGLVGNVNLLGEFTVVEWKNPPVGIKETALLFFSEINYKLIQGVDLKFQYNYASADRPERPDVVRHAVGMGAEIFLLAGLELRPLYRIHLRENEQDLGELLFMFHFYF